MAGGGGDMDFSSIESIMYGNVEDDDELMEELLALQAEEDQKAASRAPVRRQPAAAAASKQPVDFAQIDRLTKQISLEATLSDDDDDNDGTVEDDADLLNELGSLIGDEPSIPAARAADIAPVVGQKDSALISMLQQRSQSYRSAEAIAKKSGDSAKIRRLGRGLKTLEDLLKKAERGAPVDPDEVPVALSLSDTSAATSTASSAPIQKPVAPVPPAKPIANTIPSPTAPSAPRVEAKAAPAAVAVSKPAAAPLAVSRVRETLVRRRDEYKKNAALANHVKDKGAAVEFFKMAKQFDAAIAAVDSGEIGDDLDMSEVPPSPAPYKGPSQQTFERADQPKASAQGPPMGIPPPARTFLEGLEQRLAKYRDAVQRAKAEDNERKQRQNERIVKQYEDAIKAHKAGRPVDVLELPAPPGYPPLPSINARAAAPVAAASGGAVARQPKEHPAGPFGAVVPLTDGGPSPPKQSRNSQQLDFLENRQLQFKQAALLAKRKGDMATAKKFLLNAKGFDKMIEASRAGLPVNIKDAPIPPQVRTAPHSMEPAIAGDSSATSPVSIAGTREEVFATLELDLIRQVQICDRNREYFTRLGDVGQVNKYETQASALKKDLVTLRQAAKGGDPLPRFRYETKAFPSLDICPDLGDDDLELTIVRGLQVKLPAGYEEHHADIFVRYEFPFPQETPQTGKTKNIAGTSNPVFGEKLKLTINRKSRQLTRLTKRHGCKFEVFQKVGMFRSDKLLGTCESKLLPLETKSEIHESLDLMEGRKTVGGKLEIKMRIREPLVDKKATVVREKWLVIDEFARRPLPPVERGVRSSGALPVLSTRVATGPSASNVKVRNVVRAGEPMSRSQERTRVDGATHSSSGSDAMRRASHSSSTSDAALRAPHDDQQQPKGLRRSYQL